MNDPMMRTGQRAHLGAVLERILGTHAIEVEFLSSMRRPDTDGCLVYGVFRGPSHLSFPSFKHTTPSFREAVMEAFGYESDFSSWTFDVSVEKDSFNVVDKLSSLGLDQRLLQRIELNFVMDSAAVPSSHFSTDATAGGGTSMTASDAGDGYNAFNVTGALPAQPQVAPMTTSVNAEQGDGNTLAIAGAPRTEMKEEEPPTMTGTATAGMGPVVGAGGAAGAGAVEMGQLAPVGARDLEAVPSVKCSLEILVEMLKILESA